MKNDAKNAQQLGREKAPRVLFSLDLIFATFLQSNSPAQAKNAQSVKEQKTLNSSDAKLVRKTY